MKILGYPLTDMQTNCYLVYDEKAGDAVLFDPAGYSKKIGDTIKDNDLTLHYVILTHGHGDHIGGVEDFMKEFPGSKLIISAIDAPMIASADVNFSKMMYGRAIELTPDIKVKDGDVINAGSLEMKFIATPGHTQGSMSVLIGDSLFSGDTLFRESIGRTDLQGGDFVTLMNSIKKKLFLLPDDTHVYPGHMGTTTIGHEKENNPFVN